MDTLSPHHSLEAVPWVPRPDVRAVREPGATVLMDSAGGKYFKLNVTGSVIWDALSARKSHSEILADLQTRFPKAGPRLRSDLDSLLEQLSRCGLIIPRESILVPAPALDNASPAVVPAKEPPATPVMDEGSRQGLRTLGLLRAYLALVCADLVLLIAGYSRFARLIRKWPVSRRRLQSISEAAVCAEVDAAARFYFKHAWCLQRSAVTACLLRREGRSAQTVMGVRELPFSAHAWVELGGKVINDDPRVRRYYREIERL